MNPNIPCPAGLVPVMIDDQATEETSGIEDYIFLNVPLAIISLVFGIIPLSDKCLSKSNGTPSKPRTMILLLFLITGNIHSILPFWGACLLKAGDSGEGI